MGDEREHEPIELVEAQSLGGLRLRAEDLCLRLGISHDLLEVCLRWDVIESPQPDDEGVRLFSEAAIGRVRQALRLHDDLGINWAGIAVVLDLLDRIEALERELQARSGPF